MLSSMLPLGLVHVYAKLGTLLGSICALVPSVCVAQDNNDKDREEEKDGGEEAAEEEEDDVDDDVADPTYKLGTDMLDFDFDDINEELDSDDESVIDYGKKKKSKRSPKKEGKRKSATHDDGDPERPDVSQLSTEEANARLTQYCNERKAFTDCKRVKRIQDGEVVNLHPYTGNNSSVLRTMTEVENAHLAVGHSFSDKDVLMLRIAEEANLRGIDIRTVRSDNSNIRKTGNSFNVCVQRFQN